jgi:hypothetical protein
MAVPAWLVSQNVPKYADFSKTEQTEVASIANRAAVPSQPLAAGLRGLASPSSNARGRASSEHVAFAGIGSLGWRFFTGGARLRSARLPSSSWRRCARGTRWPLHRFIHVVLPRCRAEAAHAAACSFDQVAPGGRCLTRHLAAIRSHEHAGMAGIARPGRHSVSTTGVGLRGLAERLQ